MEMKPLNDERMREFIVNGYLTVKTELPPEFHEDIYKQTKEMFDNEGQPGNNLLPRIPAIRAVLEDPGVAGALTASLGHSYFMYPHRFVHFNKPGSPGQSLHMDGMTRRRHHTRWVMAMYYPQDTTEEMGPTGILPRSHYYGNRDRRVPPWGDSQGGVPASGPAGTVNIVHYDIWHRGMANRSKKDRFMMKFLFTRMEEPRSPSWDSEQAEWVATGDGGNDAMWAHQWDWHSGRRAANGPTPAGDLSADIERLQEAGTATSLHSVYGLGAIGSAAVPALVELLRDESETLRRNASYALTAIGEPAVDELGKAMHGPDWWTRATAAETIADIGLPAQAAIPALVDGLTDRSEAVRAQAAEALGTTSQMGPTAVPALAVALDDEDVLVRRNAALSLCRIGPHAHEAVPALKKALQDENRYVRGKAMHTLYRIGTPVAQEVLIDNLMTSRWDPLTKAGSYY